MTRTPTATIQTVRYEKRLTPSMTDGVDIGRRWWMQTNSGEWISTHDDFRGDGRRWWLQTGGGRWIHAQPLDALLDRVDELETALAEIRFESSAPEEIGFLADAALVGTDR